MSLAQQIQAINMGLFNPKFAPTALEEIPATGKIRAVNWHLIRPALQALQAMPWYRFDNDWIQFLDINRYPVGLQMDLTYDEVMLFQALVQKLVAETREGVRVLSSLQPELSSNDVTVTISSLDLETIVRGTSHVQRTAELAAIDDAITVSSLQPGSLDIVLTAGMVTLYGLQLAIVLARLLKDPGTTRQILTMKRLLERLQYDGQADEDIIHETVLEEAKDAFWGQATESLQIAVEGVGKNFHESKNRIDQAAKEIYENSDGVSTHWQLPPAIISGLPGGMMVSLNYEDPESIGRVVRALNPALDKTQEDG